MARFEIHASAFGTDSMDTFSCDDFRQAHRLFDAMVIASSQIAIYNYIQLVDTESTCSIDPVERFYYSELQKGRDPVIRYPHFQELLNAAH